MNQDYRFKLNERHGFKEFINTHDKIRGTNIFDSCPEFIELWDNIK